jgi:sigma-E factor negative regulatory protein RseB
VTKRILFVVLYCCAFGAAAANSPEKWLVGMQNAATQLNYEGVFVYLHGNQLDAMQVAHAVVDGTPRERLYSLNGEAREIIRDAEQVWCYLPDRKMGVREYRKVGDVDFPSILPDSLGQLDAGYRLESGRRDRIAERTAQQVIIKPRDEFRYGYRLWADVDTGLLLKADLLGSDGEPIEQYMFTQISIGKPISAERFRSRTPKESLKWHSDGDRPLTAPAGDATWTVATLPPGYMQTSSMTRFLPMKKIPVEHLVYSDGMSTVSVFIEKQADDADAMEGLSRMGAVHAYGRVIDGYQVTVVGEVPAATVERMGKSLEKRKPQK